MNHRQPVTIAVLLITAVLATASLRAGTTDPEVIAGIKTIRLIVSQDYGKAKKVDLPFAPLARAFIKAGGFDVIDGTAQPTDALLEIAVRGEAISAMYLGAGTRYAGARLKGNVTLSAGKDMVYSWPFISEIKPNTQISGARYKTPDDAPFEAAFDKSGFHKALPDLLWDVFGSSRRETIINGFIASLKSSDVYVVSGSCHALGRAGDRRAGESLLQTALEHRNFGCRDEAAKALKQLDVGWARDILLKELKSIDPYRRMCVIDALDTLRDPAALPALIDRLLHDPDHASVRQVAARALGNLGDAAAVEALVEALLYEQNGLVRMVAAESLGKIGDRRAREALVKASTDDSDVWVRKAAEEALKKIG